MATSRRATVARLKVVKNKAKQILDKKSQAKNMKVAKTKNVKKEVKKSAKTCPTREHGGSQRLSKQPKSQNVVSKDGKKNSVKKKDTEGKKKGSKAEQMTSAKNKVSKKKQESTKVVKKTANKPADEPCTKKSSERTHKTAIATVHGRRGKVGKQKILVPNKGGNRKPQHSLIELPDDALFALTKPLDAKSLGALDATCRSLRALHKDKECWRLLGVQRFTGLEFGKDEANFKQEVDTVDWKWRYRYFAREMCSFRQPFARRHIRSLTYDDAVARTRLRFGPDFCVGKSDVLPLYLEIRVDENADNLSFAFDDFEFGGKSSLTFSPDTGTIIKETKTQEQPRHVKGSYFQIMDYVLDFRGSFRGVVGIYVRGGRVAFFRQCDPRDRFECSGFVADFSWAHDNRAAPGMAFRDCGAYSVTIAKVGYTPPWEPKVNAHAFNPSMWKELNWMDGE